jgi:L-proline amide hydrolase
MPEFAARSFAKLARNPQVYRTMNGPTEFHIVGTLREWEVLSRLCDVTEPVLLTSGRHDEATPAQVAGIRERLPHAEWVVFEASGHLSHAEEPDRYMAVLADFLARAESGRVAVRGDVADAAGLGPPLSAGAGRLTGRPGPA